MGICPLIHGSTLSLSCSQCLYLPSTPTLCFTHFILWISINCSLKCFMPNCFFNQFTIWPQKVFSKVVLNSLILSHTDNQWLICFFFFNWIVIVFIFYFSFFTCVNAQNMLQAVKAQTKPEHGLICTYRTNIFKWLNWFCHGLATSSGCTMPAPHTGQQWPKLEETDKDDGWMDAELIPLLCVWL